MNRVFRTLINDFLCINKKSRNRSGFLLEYVFYFFDNQFGGYILHAGKVAAHAWLVAVDAARTARQVKLYDIVGALMPSHEACVRMSGSPDAYDRSIDERSQMHIGTIHAQHDVEMTH